jgi:transposase
MRRPVALRTDYDAAELRRIAEKSADVDQARRLLVLAAIYDGRSRRNAARAGGASSQAVRHWVLRFNAHGPAGLIVRKSPGRPPRLKEWQRAMLVAATEIGPDGAEGSVARLRLIDVRQWLWDRFEVSVSIQTLSRELRALGYQRRPGRPRHTLRHGTESDSADVPVPAAELSRRGAARLPHDQSRPHA